MKTLFWAAAAILTAADVASAQATWAYRGRVAVEAAMQQANASSPLVPPGFAAWDAAALLVASADASWEPSSRLRLAGGGIVTASDTGDVGVRAREAYARVSVGPWMDVEAGKRLVRWGVGYGFSPTGILDPPRVATDPNDRLGRNEGLTLVRADLFRGPASLTVAGASPSDDRHAASGGDSRLIAARLRTVVGGVEIAVVGAASSSTRPSYGASVTHVIGQQLEWHAEILMHDRAVGGVRTFSGVAGLQYTFAAGVNVVVEYHRNGRGMNGQSLFIRAVRADTERGLVPEFIVIANLDDGGWTVAPAITWAAHERFQVFARSTHLAGGPRSMAAFAPWSTALTLGASARF